ncbi:MAG: alpha-(1-_3)-arabinofuranosyltransferase domain-containing protein [Solirubrobacteraceae bacterium]
MEAAVQERSGRTLAVGRGRAARARAIPLGLALAAFALAFAQRPGLDTADTKVNLHVDPVRFLSDLISVWSPTASLGHVQGGQYSGYLWPMGPFFAAGHGLGISGWVTERLWLGALFALAAWGAVRLGDELLGRRRGVTHLVAGAAYMVNPYVVVFANRTSIFLLAYAALPWLMLIAHRGLRNPRGWWWPAAFALLTTSTGGGVNATVTALVMIGPILLVLYAVAIGEIALRAAVSFSWRTILATGAASVWWVAPLLVQSRYGLNFLAFTEQVGAIWGTTSLTEGLRLMSYWPSYLGVGFGDRLLPYFNDSPTMLFNPAVVLSSLLVPALALGGYAWTRRRRYAPLLLACGLVALLVMSVGYPNGTLLRSGVTFIYNRVAAVQFLRTTYKAGPVLALAVAMLLGTAAGVASGRIPRVAGRGVLLAVTAALLVLSALPMFEGKGLELTFKRVPPDWGQARPEPNLTPPANRHALVLPHQA